MTQQIQLFLPAKQLNLLNKNKSKKKAVTFFKERRHIIITTQLKKHL